MNLRTCFVQAMVLSMLVLACSGAVVDGSGTRSKSKGRKCRCKKHIAKMERSINEKIEAFELKFELLFNQTINDLSNKTHKSVIEKDSKINAISEDFVDTKRAMEMETYSLKSLQHTLESHELALDALNSSFKTLGSIVKNISSIVERLKKKTRAFGKENPTSDGSKQRHNKRENKPSAITYPKDCDEVYQSGGMQYLGDYYIVVQPEKSRTSFKTVCKIIDGAGWTVIQRRQDGRENFSRDWLDYKNGFGDLQNEFWLGNEKIHQLTTQGDYELKIDMQDWKGKKYVAIYDRFRVSDENDNYRLHVDGYHGNAGDSLTPRWKTHDGVPFSTIDRDNDRRYYDNCAEKYSGGWWFHECFESHLNGKYYQNGSHENFFIRNGIHWKTIHSYSSLKFVEMMIQPSDAKLPNDI